MNVYDEEDDLLAAVGAIEDDEASGEVPTAEAIARRLGRKVALAPTSQPWRQSFAGWSAGGC